MGWASIYQVKFTVTKGQLSGFGCHDVPLHGNSQQISRLHHLKDSNYFHTPIRQLCEHPSRTEVHPRTRNTIKWLVLTLDV